MVMDEHALIERQNVFLQAEGFIPILLLIACSQELGLMAQGCLKSKAHEERIV
jgi:hypothetical protein